jgi:CDP-4-dehydro-6-deoxyglucose reductase, E3
VPTNETLSSDRAANFNVTLALAETSGTEQTGADAAKVANKSFSVGSDETVLNASRRAGLALPYSCLSGRCGSCSTRVLSGTWRYAHPPSALNAIERLDHALLCQALPCSDLRLALREVADVARVPIVQTQAQLIAKSALSPDVLLLELALDQPVRYLAGQYLEFVLPEGKRRPFSIANAPRSDGVLELHVRKVAGGGFTQQLFEATELGARFTLDLPHGTFVPRANSDRPLLLVAGGTGFAPIKALLEHFSVTTPHRSTHLYWGARVAADFYLPESIRAFQRLMPQLKLTQVLSEQASTETRYGTLHEAVLEDYPQLADMDVYMSGPPAMISSCRASFLAAALPEDRLYYDSFDFAPDVLAKLLHAR